MLPRLLPLLGLPLVLATLAQAAPAPLRKAEPTPQPEVQLSGWLPDPRLAAGAPWVIVRQADYQSAARACGIAEPPRVNFRTHFVALHASAGHGGALRFELDGRGD